MVNAITPSVTPITKGQVAKFDELWTAALRKSEIPSNLVQEVLKTHGGTIAHEFVAIVRERAEAISNTIVRKVKVNRARQPQAAISATGRTFGGDGDVVATMPRGEGDEAEVVFFKPDDDEYTRPGSMSDDDLEKCLARRSLVAAPPDDVAAVNEDDPSFADKYPNCTHWKNADGEWCYAAFNRWYGERDVSVRRHDVFDWVDYWWFAGRRKKYSST